MPGERAEHAFVPGDHRREDLGHDDGRLLAERVEAGAQRVAHSQSPDQDARGGPRRQRGQRQPRQLLLRPVAAARHQLVAVDVDVERVAAPRQHQLAAVGRDDAIQDGDGLHSASRRRASSHMELRDSRRVER